MQLNLYYLCSTNNIVLIIFDMALITLNIPENKISFVRELIDKFDFIKIEKEDVSLELTEKQKNILNERLVNYENNPDSYLDMDEVKDNLKKDYGL
ncbi:MAG: hypothetical protein B6I18_08515 [Bacteroidetes bacterium 4572_112]|nr:MAG: hypothetical protein B6I18_08515 [Bacteroidetes bacterium 4572_112]